jgi:hypothetical protein
MAEKKTESKSEDQGGGTAPALHLTPAVPNVALATKAQRSIPVTDPDSEVVGADAYNRAVTRAPEPLAKPVTE